MARRQRLLLHDLFDLLKNAPRWVGPVVAGMAVLFFLCLLPALLSMPWPGAVETGPVALPFFAMLGLLFAIAILLTWVMAEFWKLSNRRRLDRQTGLQSIRRLPWPQFEHLVCEAYRRKGYFAQVVGGASPDGGVDIRLTAPGETILVQCKQWRAWTVGVTTVRELLGIVVSERATKGILVTSGRFTQAARIFAARNPCIELADGPQLAELVRNVQSVPRFNVDPSPPPAPQPACPRCGSVMVLRTARNGRHAGSQFWGCSKFPGCRGIRSYRSMAGAGNRG